MQVGAKEKQVSCYPTYGYQQNGQWQIPLRIWVREPADLPLRLAASWLRRILRRRAGLDALTEAQKARFNERASAFIADRESFEQVEFRFDHDPLAEVFLLSDASGSTRTDFNGLLEGELRLSLARAQQLLAAQPVIQPAGQQGWLRFQAVSANHEGSGWIQLLEPTGLSVISDIDDTVKITGFVEPEGTVIRNTFFEPFRAAPGMAAMYRALVKTDNAAFHYVSGGPWQLYPPLADFLFARDAGFPLGSVHMKNVRTNPFESESYGDFLKLLGGSGSATIAQKQTQISQLLNHFPQRQFILIGDSGEHDPEIFNLIRQQFPDQIREIRIRDVAQAGPEGRLAGMTVIPVP